MYSSSQLLKLIVLYITFLIYFRLKNYIVHYFILIYYKFNLLIYTIDYLHLLLQKSYIIYNHGLYLIIHIVSYFNEFEVT